MYSFSFFPLITKPTRVTTRSSTCIDNIFTNVLDKPILPGILYSDLSDHFPVFQITYSMPPKYHAHLNSESHSQLQVDFNALIEELAAKDWSIVITNHDVDEAYSIFVGTLQEIIDKHSRKLPHSKKKRKTPKKPWITKAILKSINKKQRLYRTFLKSKTPAQKKKYTTFRNKLNSIIRESRKAHFVHKLELNFNNLKCTWKILNDLLGKCRSKLPTFIKKKIDNTKVKEPCV